MKKRIGITLWAMLFVTAGFAQQIPDTVMQVFKNTYPGVQNVTWRTENDLYFASYEDTGKIGHTVVYDRHGRMDRHQFQVGPKDVPNGIVDYYRTHYPGQKKYDVWLEQDQNGKKKYYVPGSGETLYFDEQGNYLNKQGNTGTGTNKSGGSQGQENNIYKKK
jgi:hypothetical protein